jgi:hypothetical protein
MLPPIEKELESAYGECMLLLPNGAVKNGSSNGSS